MERPSRASLRTVHEERIITEWLGWLVEQGRAVGTPTFGDAPDCRVAIDGRPTSVELACGYADDPAAVWLLQTAEVTNTYFSSSGPMVTETQRIVVGGKVDALVESLQLTMDRHCRSRYGRSYLILDPSHDELGVALAGVTARLVVPADCAFTGIHLVVPEFRAPRRFVRLWGSP